MSMCIKLQDMDINVVLNERPRITEGKNVLLFSNGETQEYDLIVSRSKPDNKLDHNIDHSYRAPVKRPTPAYQKTTPRKPSAQ